MDEIVAYILETHCLDYSEFAELGIELRQHDFLWEQEYQEFVDFEKLMEYLATSTTFELEDHLRWLYRWDYYSQGNHPEDYARYIEIRFFKHELEKREAMNKNWLEDGF